MTQKITFDLALANQRSQTRLSETAGGDIGIQTLEIAGARVYDFGVHGPGSLAAGVLLAQVSAGDGLQISVLEDDSNMELKQAIRVQSDDPIGACLGCQYAGWPLSVGKYFAMVSGPIRGLRGKEPLWQHFERSQSSPCGVAVLESDRLPDAEVVQAIAAATGLSCQQLHLCVAPTASLAGTVQVVARSLETALHQWEHLGGPLAAFAQADSRSNPSHDHMPGNVVSLVSSGTAPLPPLAKDSLTAIGWTNDAIIFHGDVEFQVSGDYEMLLKFASEVPSENSKSFGQTFLSLFKQCGHDFYKMDPRLFSPARLTLNHVRSGQKTVFGHLHPDKFLDSVK